MATVLPSIPAKRYFTIGEVGELCDVKPHVLRYWEQEFTQLKPMKRRGNRRYYQHHEVLLVRRDLAGDGARRLCDAVSRTCGGRCAVFSGEGERYQYAVIHPGADLREFVKHMNDALHGRGGGRSGFAQGSVAADEAAIRAFFRGV